MFLATCFACRLGHLLQYLSFDCTRELARVRHCQRACHGRERRRQCLQLLRVDVRRERGAAAVPDRQRDLTNDDARRAQS